jgi:hypothetical protein
MTTTAESYRNQAQECVRQAQVNPHERSALLQMASNWMALAETEAAILASNGKTLAKFVPEQAASVGGLFK